MKKRILFFCLFSLTASLEANDLVGVYNDAAQSSPILKSDWATYEAAHANVPIAVSALLPQVALTGSAEAINTDQPGIVSNTTYPTALYSVSVTQPLFNYNQFAGVAQAKESSNAAEATYQSQLQSFVLTLAEDYFNVLEAQDNVSFAQAQLLSLTTTLHQTREKFEAGVATYTDVAQAKANADSAQAQLVQNQEALVNANETLWTLTGKKEDNLAKVKSDFPYTPPVPDDETTWVHQSLTQNAALLAQQATTSAALASVHQAVGNQLPNVSLVASYGEQFYRESVPLGISASGQISAASIELALTWTVFSGGELMASTLQAANQYASSEDTTENLYRTTQSDAQQDFLSVIANMSQVSAYKQSVIAAQSTLNDYNAKYKVGTATIVDVLNATQTLYQDQSSLAQAEYAYIDSLLQLKFDAGTLNPKDLDYFNQYLQVTE